MVMPVCYKGGSWAFLVNNVNEVNSRTHSHYESKSNRSTVTKLLFVEGFFCAAALALFDATSVVAMFLSTLNATAWQIGLVSAIRLVGFRTPQVFVATRFYGRLNGVLVKFVSFQWLATVFMALSPVAAHFMGSGPALTCFVIGWACFSFGEGASFVPWSETVASAVGRRCAKFLGAYGLVESLGTMFAGMVVYMFAKTGAMGNNLGYLGVFSLGSLGIMVTVPVLRRVEHYDDLARISRRRRFGLPGQVQAEVRAQPGEVTGKVLGEMTAKASGKMMAWVPGQIPGQVGNANAFKAFRRALAMPGGGFRAFVGAQLLSMGIYLMSPFILLYGCNELGFTTRATSLVVWAEMAGISAGGILAGRLASRSGSRAVVKLSCIVSAAVPLLAVLSGVLPIGAPVELGVAAVMASMLCLGIFHGSSWVGCTGYIVESTGEKDRPMVVAVLNLIVLPFLCLSPVGGLAVKQVGYMPVFAATLIPCLASAVLAFKVD